MSLTSKAAASSSEQLRHFPAAEMKHTKSDLDVEDHTEREAAE